MVVAVAIECVRARLFLRRVVVLIYVGITILKRVADAVGNLRPAACCS